MSWTLDQVYSTGYEGYTTRYEVYGTMLEMFENINHSLSVFAIDVKISFFISKMYVSVLTSYVHVHYVHAC